MRPYATLAAIAMLGFSLGCTHVHVRSAAPVPAPAKHVHVKRTGPPPHAPAHGYRAKHRTAAGHVQLVFDSGLGVYVVVGRPDHYYHRDHFYRWHDGGWTVSARLDRGWVTVSSGKLPGSLRAKHGHRGHGRKKGRHQKHPANHAH